MHASVYLLVSVGRNGYSEEIRTSLDLTYYQEFGYVQVRLGSYGPEASQSWVTLDTWTRDAELCALVAGYRADWDWRPTMDRLVELGLVAAALPVVEVTGFELAASEFDMLFTPGGEELF